jgi:hypothetical protein
LIKELKILANANLFLEKKWQSLVVKRRVHRTSVSFPRRRESCGYGVDIRKRNGRQAMMFSCGAFLNHARKRPTPPSAKSLIRLGKIILSAQ